MPWPVVLIGAKQQTLLSTDAAQPVVSSSSIPVGGPNSSSPAAHSTPEVLALPQPVEATKPSGSLSTASSTFDLALKKRGGAPHTAERPNWALAPDEPPALTGNTSRQSRQRRRGKGRADGEATSKPNSREHSRVRGSNASRPSQTKSLKPRVVTPPPSTKTPVEEKNPVAPHILLTPVHAEVKTSSERPGPVSDPATMEVRILVDPPAGSKGPERSKQLELAVEDVQPVQEASKKRRSKSSKGPNEGPEQWLERVNSWIGQTQSVALQESSQITSGSMSVCTEPSAPSSAPGPSDRETVPTSSDYVGPSVEKPSHRLNKNAPAWEPRTRTPTRASSEAVTSPTRSAAPSPALGAFAYGVDADIENLRVMLRNCGIRDRDAKAAAESLARGVPVASDKASSGSAPDGGRCSTLPTAGPSRSTPGKVESQSCQYNALPPPPPLQHPTFLPFPENITRPPIRPRYDEPTQSSALATPGRGPSLPGMDPYLAHLRGSSGANASTPNHTPFFTPPRPPFASTPPREFAEVPHFSPSPAFPGSYTVVFKLPDLNDLSTPSRPQSSSTPASGRARQSTSQPGQPSPGWHS